MEDNINSNFQMKDASRQNDNEENNLNKFNIISSNPMQTNDNKYRDVMNTINSQYES